MSHMLGDKEITVTYSYYTYPAYNILPIAYIYIHIQLRLYKYIYAGIKKYTL